MLRKNFLATGSFIEADRPRALDLLGFASQLVFDTFTSPHVLRIERDSDPALAVEIAAGSGAPSLDWCSVDPRLLPVVVVPLGDCGRRGRAQPRSDRRRRARALMIGQYCPPGHSPEHVDLEPVWAMAAEAGVPIVLHVAGAGANVMNPTFFENGLPPVPDFHGGDGNFKSLDYLSIPLPVMQTLNALVIDGVLQRHPDLRVGVIEVGASWIPSWMRSLDSAHEAFRKNEERLQRMEMRPSEYVQRQVRATPYPHEDTGWTIANTGPEVCLFSSDFPHVEGGRNPIGRFERSMDAAGTSDGRPPPLLLGQLRRPAPSRARAARRRHRRRLVGHPLHELVELDARLAGHAGARHRLGEDRIGRERFGAFARRELVDDQQGVRVVGQTRRARARSRRVTARTAPCSSNTAFHLS